jgi:recombinational DNA repair protein RecR
MRGPSSEDRVPVVVATGQAVERDALVGPLDLEGDAHRQRAAGGGDLEYADELTLGRALEGRRELDA